MCILPDIIKWLRPLSPWKQCLASGCRFRNWRPPPEIKSQHYTDERIFSVQRTVTSFPVKQYSSRCPTRPHFCLRLYKTKCKKNRRKKKYPTLRNYQKLLVVHYTTLRVVYYTTCSVVGVPSLLPHQAIKEITFWNVVSLNTIQNSD